MQFSSLCFVSCSKPFFSYGFSCPFFGVEHKCKPLEGEAAKRLLGSTHLRAGALFILMFTPMRDRLQGMLEVAQTGICSLLSC